MNIDNNILNKAKGIINSNDFKDELKSKLNKSNNIISEEVKNDLKEDVIIIEDGLNKEIFTTEIVKEFIDFVKTELGIKDKPIYVRLADNRKGFATHAYYEVGDGKTHVYANNRSQMDVFRSLSHEAKHWHQDHNNEINNENSGEDNTGVDIENEANIFSGIIIRKWGKLHPECYDK